GPTSSPKPGSAATWQGHSTKRSESPPGSPNRATPCCSPRVPPASTSSSPTRREARHSPKPSPASTRRSSAHDEQRHLDRPDPDRGPRSEEHTSELQSRENLVCRLLLQKKTTLTAPPPSRTLRP